MDWNMIITIAISIIGSSAVFGFVQFLITRRDAKKNKKNENQAQAGYQEDTWS